ncbi:MAG: YjgP/YjgQ family permease [Verrucomicrobia bacterium]|nr:YjgP/YjgQ family permease [Verrucomicrobiota bacterium]
MADVVVTSEAVRILDRYILREWAKVFSLCLLSFCGILLISEAYNWIPPFLSWGSSPGTILSYLWSSVVIRVSLITPISLMISVVFVLSSLNKNHELAAARAAGMSMGRITAPLWWVGLFLVGLLFLLNAVLVPNAIESQNALLEREQFAALKEKGGSVAQKSQVDYISFHNSKDRRFWLITRMGLNSGQAFEVAVDSFDEQGRRVRSIKADFADFKKIDGVWQWSFRQGRDLKFNPVNGSLMAQPYFKELKVADYHEDPEVMLYSTRDPETLSLRELSRYVAEAGVNADGKNASYAMRFHSFLAAPVICLVVIAVAIPFSVTGGRISPMVGVAKSFALFLAFFFLSSICSAFGENGALPPLVAAWLPTVITAFWAIPKLKSVN